MNKEGQSEVRLDLKLLSLLRCPKCSTSMSSSLKCSKCGYKFRSEPPVIVALEESTYGDIHSIHEYYEGRTAWNIGYIPGQNIFKDWVYFNLVKLGICGQLRYVLGQLDKENKVAIELACGGGIKWMGTIAATIGIDVSRLSLEQASKSYDLVIQADIRDVPLVDSCADLVWGSYVYEHLSSKDKDAVLAEAYRLLKPGGWCVLQFPTLGNNAILRFAQKDPDRFFKGFVENDMHIGLESLPDAVDRIRRSGFEIHRVMRFGTTILQSLVVYNWLCLGYKDRYRWVRLLDRFKNALASNRLGLYWELGVTAFDRLCHPITKNSKATQGIVVARKR